MKKRLHHALIEATEIRALLVLHVVVMLRARRALQALYILIPTIHEVIENYRRWLRVRLSYWLYQAHWI